MSELQAIGPRPISPQGESETHLRALQHALAQLGMQSRLDCRAIWPRLRVYSPYEMSLEVAEFENSVVAVQFSDGWWFAWAWAEKICEVANTSSAASRIAGELGEFPGRDEHEEDMDS